MALSERQTDLIVRDLMKQAGLNPWAEKCPINEVSEALKTASKRGSEHVGKPEYIVQVGRFLMVVEDKAYNKFQANYMTDKAEDTLLMDVPSVKSYAENGALHYAQHIACKTNFDRIFAFGCSGSDEDKLIIRPIYVTKTGYKILSRVKDFSDFSAENIDNYYFTKVLEGKTVQQMELELILSRAQKLHEDLRNYGSLSEQEKPIIVSAILLALCNRSFSSHLLSDINNTNSDGEIIYDAVEEHLREVSAERPFKVERVLTHFEFIKYRPLLSSMHPVLGKSPLKYFTEYIDSRVYAAICNNTPDDVLGRFYGEFLSYSGGDGKGLGIVLTPSHITQLMVDLLDVKPTDKVFDPCCGTGGFLIAAMHKMFKLVDEKYRTQTLKRKEIRSNIKKDSLHGVEANDRMFSIAATNMILRGDGKSNLLCEDFFKLNADKLREKGYTVGLMNPPYSQAKNSSTAHLSELAFIKHLLDSLADGARCAVIVPQSTMVGKTTNDAAIKRAILKRHTLKGVITLNPQTFYGVGTNPVIAVFTAYEPHQEKRCKFINFKEDGYYVAPHIGLVDDGTFEDKKKELLDCWFDHKDPSSKAFMLKSPITADDEWLHSYYYFNEEIPDEADFEQTMADYLTFEFKMIVEGKGYLFGFDENN